MKECEFLYQKKLILENEIAKNKLFKLSMSAAIQCVMTKVGMLYSLFKRCEYDKKQEYMKGLIRTNATYIDEISFFQESLKWICRWCSKYCPSQNECDEKILANQVYELMGLAYSYDVFTKYSFYHNKHIVIYHVFGNNIQFEYVNEKSHQVHEIYDTLNRYDFDKRICRDILDNNIAVSDIELIEAVHRSDFIFNYNFNFGKFSLKEYEEVSVVLNNYIMRKMLKNHVLVPGEEGNDIWEKNELINMLVDESGVEREKVIEMIDFFKYNKADVNGDLSLNYFFELADGKIMLSEGVFSMQRPAINALRILARRQSVLYEAEQNMFEIEQKNRLKKIVSERFLVAKALNKEQEIRPGMDMLIYDEKNNHLQVIELKYKIPVDSERDFTNLDDMLKKAYAQLEWAERYVTEHEGILEEYFGSEYGGVIPKKIDYFVITNYSIGTGVNSPFPSPIMLEEQYLKLMQLDNGMRNVREVLRDEKKGMVGEIKKRYARFGLINFKIKIPETLLDSRT